MTYFNKDCIFKNGDFEGDRYAEDSFFRSDFSGLLALVNVFSVIPNHPADASASEII